MVLPGISQGPQFLNSTWNDQFITQLQMIDLRTTVARSRASNSAS